MCSTSQTVNEPSIRSRIKESKSLGRFKLRCACYPMAAPPPPPTDLGLELTSPPTDGVTSLRFGDDSGLLLATSWDAGVRLYDADPRAQTSQMRQHFTAPGPVFDACFAAGGDTAIVSGGLSKSVVRHDLTSGVDDVVGTHGAAVRCVEWDHETGLILSGGWDGRLKCWDARLPTERRCVADIELPGKVYSMSLTGNGSSTRRLVVAMAGRAVHVYTPMGLAMSGKPEQTRESPMGHQSRCVRWLPDGTGFALSSVEGRVAWEYLDQDPVVQEKKYAFKCHRVKDQGVETVHPVHAVAFHPWGTFATGGGDGIVNVWDGAHKKRLYQYPKYATSVAALAFDGDGQKLAVAASYVGERGDVPAPADAVFVRKVEPGEVTPKSGVPK